MALHSSEWAQVWFSNYNCCSEKGKVPVCVCVRKWENLSLDGVTSATSSLFKTCQINQKIVCLVWKFTFHFYIETRIPLNATILFYILNYYQSNMIEWKNQLWPLQHYISKSPILKSYKVSSCGITQRCSGGSLPDTENVW